VQEVPSLLAQLVKAFTAADFPELISRRSMLPLIVFAVGVGLATRACGEAGVPFGRFLASGAAVFIRMVDYVMYAAPLGLLAWFAATVVDTGAALASAYFRVFVVYYVFAALYFAGGFSLYAYLAGGRAAVRRFWSRMLGPSLTALGTCSSMATMPVNLEEAPRMGVPEDVCDVVIPVGAALHKDGSVIGGVLKVLFAMSLFHQELTPGRLLMAVGVAILVGVVMGAIPGGGMIGEMLVLSVFGFPAEALPLLAAISVIIDPLATLLNATGDNVAAMLVARLTAGKEWSTIVEEGT
jgi:Na+/H+-dicarboxylate symporter